MTTSTQTSGYRFSTALLSNLLYQSPLITLSRYAQFTKSIFGSMSSNGGCYLFLLDLFRICPQFNFPYEISSRLCRTPPLPRVYLFFLVISFDICHGGGQKCAFAFLLFLFVFFFSLLSIYLFFFRVRVIILYPPLLSERRNGMAE